MIFYNSEHEGESHCLLSLLLGRRAKKHMTMGLPCQPWCTFNLSNNPSWKFGSVQGSPSDLNTGHRIEGCPSWCRPLRPLFHFLCSNLKANPVHQFGVLLDRLCPSTLMSYMEAPSFSVGHAHSQTLLCGPDHLASIAANAVGLSGEERMLIAWTLQI